MVRLKEEQRKGSWKQLPQPLSLQSGVTLSSWPYGSHRGYPKPGCLKVKDLPSEFNLRIFLIFFILSESQLIKEGRIRLWNMLSIANQDYVAVWKLPCRLNHLPSQKLIELLFPCVPVSNACVMASVRNKGKNKRKERVHFVTPSSQASHSWYKYFWDFIFLFLDSVSCFC